MRDVLAAVLGWMGTIGTLSAFLLSSYGKLPSPSARYAALNAIGGFAGGVACVMYGAWPSVFSSFVWAAVSTHALVNALTVGRRPAPSAAVADDFVTAA